MTLVEGQTVLLGMRVETTAGARRTVARSTSDPDIAKVRRGKLTYLASVLALSPGVTQITATSTVDRAKSGAITVTVVQDAAATGM